MSIKKIFDEIAAEPGSNKKMEILGKYKKDVLLENVLYLAKSKRVKFYIKQIPAYKTDSSHTYSLAEALKKLDKLSNREVTGHDAIEYLRDILSSVRKDDAYVIERIIEKDLKIGMGTSNINKVFESLIEKTPYMGAKPYDIKLVEKIIVKGKAKSQIKMDGRYQNAIIRDGEVWFETRQGEETVLTGAKFLKELSTLADEVVLNGELTIIGVPVRSIANGIISSLDDILSKTEERGKEETDKKIKEFFKKHGEELGGEHVTIPDVLNRIVYTCWDIITVDEYYAKESKTPYDERLAILEKIIKDKKPTLIQVVETVEVSSMEEVMKHFHAALKAGLEGTILKEGKGAWKNGKPNHQVKFKLEINIDLKIVGFKMGTKGTKNEHVVSTLLLESSCGKLKTDPSGMNEKMMADVTKRQKELLGTIVEIRCCGLSFSKGEWSTMHPSIEELRTDKKTCDSLESAQEIENAAKGLVKTI
jgi:hypothetical protein